MKVLILLIVTFLLSGCVINSLEDARVYNGLDSYYISADKPSETSECILHGWQKVFSSRPSDVWLTKKDNSGSFSVYTPSFLYVVDVKPKGDGSVIYYYHNGDRLWSTKKNLISKINECLH